MGLRSMNASVSSTVLPFDSIHYCPLCQAVHLIPLDEACAEDGGIRRPGSSPKAQRAIQFSAVFDFPQERCEKRVSGANGTQKIHLWRTGAPDCATDAARGALLTVRYGHDLDSGSCQLLRGFGCALQLIAAKKLG